MTVLSRREARRSRRAGVAICAVATLQLAAFSWRPVADLIMGPLEGRARAMAAQAPRDGYTAILILGGGAAGPPRQANSPQHLDVSSTASRVWLAARLYHAGVAPRIIVSGRSFTTAPGKRLVSEAESVLQDLGVPVDAIVLEARSVNTRENAQESRRLIGDDARVALVTSAYHMPRAMREMRSAGVHTYAFPTDFRIRLEHRPASHQWLPTPGALQLSTLAIKEWLGMLMQSVAATKREAVILRYKRQYVCLKL